MRKRFLTLVTLFASFALLFGIWGLPIQITDAKEKDDQSIASKGTPSALKPIVGRSLRNSTSIPLREMKSFPKARPRTPHAPLLMPKAKAAGGTRELDGALSKAPVGGGIPSPFVNFEGGSDDDNETVAGRVVPPDTNGDVGPNHYVQYINLHYNIYDKAGNKLLGPIAGNAFWAGLGGNCETGNDGDPIVLYDHLADRWFVSQFEILNGPSHVCIAVSTTGDPTGSWHQYDFEYPNNLINDYPKFGVWPDGYYMTVNQFTQGFAFAGAGVMAFERDQMLDGNAAQTIYFDLFGVNPNFGGMLPSDLDGPVPPAGAPNIYAEVDDETVFGTDRLSLWEFHVDWVDTSMATFGIGGNPNLVLDTAPFQWGLCGFARNCIPQPAPGEGLDAISDRLMFRLQYRNFGAFSTLVTNHTVDADGTDHAGVRWYELRNDGSGWAINQQGTWAPDAEHRWMGSAAMDSAGNIAVGYSVSSSSTNPAVRYAGRLASDPPGDLSQGEESIIEGTGVQTNSLSRWGDYSGMVVDPSPGSSGGIDCDFWFTSEYYQNTGSFDFNTRVGGFTFTPGACGGPTGVINGTVTDSATGDPIAGATVQVQPGGFTTSTNGSGFYQFTLAVGTYDVTASAFGYISETVSGIVLDEGETETVDFALDPAATVTVQGIVTDGSGHGWPLYARIDITGFPGGPVFTNPSTGTYDVELPEGTEFVFNVSAISSGYIPQSRQVTPSSGGGSEDFQLEVDTSSCSAPGYGIIGGIFEEFEDGTTPAGWTVSQTGGDTDMIWVFNDPGGRGNLTGGDGGFAIADSDFFGNGSGPEDTEMRTPSLDFSAQSEVLVEFDTDFNWYYYSGDEKGDVDVSIDGGTTWQNVHRFEDASFRGPRHESVDISSIAAGQSDVIVRFHYYDADWEFWWQVDNVKIGAQCLPIPGGLMVGNVYDGNTDEGLNAATVASVEEPTETTTTFSTPLDAKLDEGFYILFSSLTGLHEFIASKANYGSDTHSVNVVEDAVVVQNYSLGAGILEVDPDLLEATVDLGTTQTLQLTITNNGTAAADFELVEGNGLTNGPQGESVKGQGAPLKRIKGEFSPLRPGVDRNSRTKDKSRLQKGKDGRSGGHGPASKTTPNDPPWTDIANHPIPIMDSTAAEIDGKIYSAAGLDGSLTFLNTLYVYDPPSDTWTQLASMNGQREKPTAVAIDGKLYVTNGWDPNGNPDGTLEIYDPATDTWTGGASIPVAMGGGTTGVNLDGKMYVIGGCDSGTCGFTDVQVYDPGADSWSSAADYPEPISWLACGAIGGQIYCAGGVASGESQNTYVYDPGSDTWSPLADLPQTQWAMGFVTSDELLYISGGVTDNFATVTNEGFVYDPGADTWTAIANSNNVVYRGGSACGFYKIGGSIGGFSPIPAAEVLPGLTNCGGAVDVPWLSEDPTTGTVQPGQSVVVDVTFDAGQVDQPGDYFAHLTVKENTPYTVPDVQVIMHVPLPATWGTLQGTVEGLGRCDAPGGPLAGATVFVDGQLEDFTLETDANGFYQRSFDAANSPVDITVSANGFVGQNRTGVVITAQQTTTEDFTLRLDAPCADKSPASFDVTLNVGDTTTEQLTLTNSGAGSLDFTINETTFQLPPLGPTPQNGARAGIGKLIPAAPVRGNSVRTGKAPSRTNNAPQVPNAWFFGNPVPGGITRYAHAQCDLDTNSFYVISGVDSTFSLTANTWRFDATTNTWNALAPIPSESEGPTAVCYQGKIYVMGGSGTNAHFIYDIASDTWSNGALVPRGSAGAAAGAWAGKVYLIGGDDDFFPASGVSDEVNVYDIATDTWLANATSKPIATSFPGFVQAGPFVFIVGGWGVSAPGANVAALQQYDMSTDTWTSGPDLASPRADLALGMTDTALYAIAGDADGAGFFDGTTTVERYEWASFPGGAWADPGDPQPSALQGNNAGFCTEAVAAGSEVWSVGAIRPNLSGIDGTASFRPSPTEKCFSIFSDVPWLSENPTSGTVPPDSSQIVDVTFDATALTVGDYFATLVITTNDAGAPQFNIPVALHVVDDCESVITLSPATLPNPVLNQPYDQTITASGGVAPYEFDLADGALPDGLTLNISGQISGTPTAEGTFTFTIEATDSEGCSGSQEYTVTVSATPSDLYNDQHNDQTLPPWTFTRTWLEDANGFLTTTSNNKATAIATDFSGCVNCKLSTAFQTAASSGFKVWIWFHYVDNGNKIEILFKQNKVVAKEWVGGVLMDKTSVNFTVNPNQLYQVMISYNGTQYELMIDGTSVLTFTPSGAPTGGTFGYGSKDTPVFIDYSQVVPFP